MSGAPQMLATQEDTELNMGTWYLTNLVKQVYTYSFDAQVSCAIIYRLPCFIFFFLPYPLPERQAMVMAPSNRAALTYHLTEQTRAIYCNILID